MHHPTSFATRHARLIFFLIACGVIILVIVFKPMLREQSTPTAQQPKDGASGQSKRAMNNTTASIQRATLFEKHPVLQERFTHPDTNILHIQENSVSRYFFQDGAYAIQAKSPWMLTWSLIESTETNEQDLAAQVDIRMASADVAGGLIFRYQDDANFYLFNVANSGFYDLEVVKDGKWTPLIDWTPSHAIAKGIEDTPRREAANNMTNTLRIETIGSEISLFVNGVYLETTTDNTFTQGKVALSVNTFKEQEATVFFDNIAIYHRLGSTSP